MRDQPLDTQQAFKRYRYDIVYVYSMFQLVLLWHAERMQILHCGMISPKPVCAALYLVHTYAAYVECQHSLVKLPLAWYVL